MCNTDPAVCWALGDGVPQPPQRRPVLLDFGMVKVLPEGLRMGLAKGVCDPLLP